VRERQLSNSPLSLRQTFIAIEDSGLSNSARLITSRTFVSLSDEIKKRRTFAIISHPDAGKTTLTEKLLLYGGAVQLAGSVTARKNQRASTSDWMELERKRGISVSSTVLQFEYQGYSINLLDTPGHKDFSEDTYRVLTAVDAVVMVIDAGKGIEAQTKKLFEVCRQRGIPIFTFMNKCDRPARDPLSLLDELEKVLGIQSYPVNWPIGTGVDFKGVYDRLSSSVNLFERTAGGVHRSPVSIGGFSDPFIKERLDETLYDSVSEELEMLEIAGSEFSEKSVLAGETTPVFFGSAMNNFGVKLLLDGFLQFSPPPQPRQSEDTIVEPDDESFSAFIFKIQANMDPRHRDRIAFIRICSGKFERDMSIVHPRNGKKIRLSSSHRLFGNDRETVNEAYAGDIVGLVGLNDFGIGDTLTTTGDVKFAEIPRFTPETFAYLHNSNTAKFKQFRQGLDQLLQEGVIQVLHLKDTAVRVPLLAAVGQLQFEVVQYRLETEYNAESRLETTPWEAIRWLPPEFKEENVDSIQLPTGCRIAWDLNDQGVVLFPTDWTINYFTETNKGIRLSMLPHESEAILNRK
jgi:peptide chain release factor 3